VFSDFSSGQASIDWHVRHLSEQRAPILAFHSELDTSTETPTAAEFVASAAAELPSGGARPASGEGVEISRILERYQSGGRLIGRGNSA
jgi:hypothetical protein